MAEKIHTVSFCVCDEDFQKLVKLKQVTDCPMSHVMREALKTTFKKYAKKLAA